MKEDEVCNGSGTNNKMYLDKRRRANLKGLSEVLD
jgi:hypothetical protein